MTATSHPLDEAVVLTLSQGPDPQGGTVIWQGQTHPGYANMVGPYGGITAAQAVQSVLQHPQLLGVPVALTINYAAALAYGPFTIHTRPVRTNRSTQHWTIEFVQNDDAGQPQTVITGTAMTAVRRDTYSSVDHPLPPVPSASTLATRRVKNAVEWLNRYDQRLVDGDIHTAWDGSEHDSQSTVWMSDEPPRPLDFVGLTGLADVFFPRIWRRRALRVPAGTVSMTVYYHADAAKLAATGSAHILGRARMHAAFNGYCDQSAVLWAPDGEVLATTHQLVYYKE
ncbi:acyl-CoA thioesterase [Comamonas serinivorans]|uniref:Acyl-CoA thioesterase n=1 Tax=Comamonas serinivorans TaxID=1082851 RepID=A0A1Y0EKC7_9BURK|nr:thioesterase family protein [Comamonas serinivorans]ARU03881.1 acyl-CoA thioesterase [Comamonas serinivorans]